MAKEPCTVCGKLKDTRGMTGHMRTHPQAVTVTEKKPSHFDPDSYRVGYRNGVEDAKKVA